MGFFDYERMKIAGATEHNQMIDELRKREEEANQNKKKVESIESVSEELQNINRNFQKQIDEAKASSRKANILGWLSFGVSVLSLISGILLGVLL